MPLDDAVVDYSVVGEHTTEEGAPRERVVVVAARRPMISTYVDPVRRAGLKPVGHRPRRLRARARARRADRTPTRRPASAATSAASRTSPSPRATSASSRVRSPPPGRASAPTSTRWPRRCASRSTTTAASPSPSRSARSCSPAPAPRTPSWSAGSTSCCRSRSRPRRRSAALAADGLPPGGDAVPAHRLRRPRHGSGGMRPVNLLPDDLRPRQATGRLRGSSYAVVGVLAVLLLMAVGYVLTSNKVNSHKTEIAEVRAGDRRGRGARRERWRPTRTFAQIKATRIESVKSLAGQRFDWERLMRELALVLPDGTSLTDLAASTRARTAGGGPRRRADRRGRRRRGPVAQPEGLRRAPARRGHADGPPAPPLPRDRRRADRVDRAGRRQPARPPPVDSEGTGSEGCPPRHLPLRHER